MISNFLRGRNMDYLIIQKETVRNMVDDGVRQFYIKYKFNKPISSLREIIAIEDYIANFSSKSLEVYAHKYAEELIHDIFYYFAGIDKDSFDRLSKRPLLIDSVEATHTKLKMGPEYYLGREGLLIRDCQQLVFVPNVILTYNPTEEIKAILKHHSSLQKYK